jgi:hypothetical protein
MIRSWQIQVVERAWKRAQYRCAKNFVFKWACAWALFRLAAIRPRVHLTHGTVGPVAWFKGLKQSTRYQELING